MSKQEIGLSDAQERRFREMWAMGCSPEDMAAEFHVSRSTVYKWAQVRFRLAPRKVTRVYVRRNGRDEMALRPRFRQRDRALGEPEAEVDLDHAHLPPPYLVGRPARSRPNDNRGRSGSN
jgi:transposase